MRVLLVDLLIDNGLVVCMDAKRTVIENGSVAVDGGRILAVRKSREIRRKHGAKEVVDATGQIVMPGLVCSHTHLYGMLLRGASLRISPPSDFTQILQRVWWPVDEALTKEDAYASALVGCVEFAKTGTTLFADTYSGPNSIDGVLDEIGHAVDQVGIRGFVAFEATERHSPDEGRRGVEENIRFARTRKQNRKSRAYPLLSIHASFTVSDTLIRYVREQAIRHRIPITIHTAEGMGDVHHNLENYGKRTVERLRDVGLLGPDVVLAHCVNLNDNELNILRETGAKVAHNPMSNMLNAVGVAPIPQMLARGIPVGLGNDGYIFDMFENMRVAFLLHKVHRRDPTVLSPQRVVEMATIGGARLYNMDRSVGSIERGKLADIITVKPDVLPTPLTASSVYGHIVNTVDGDDVENVVVDGRIIVSEKRLLTLNEEEAETKAQVAARNLWKRLERLQPQIDPFRK